MRTAVLALSCAAALSLSGCGGGDSGAPQADASRPPTAAPSTALVQGTLQLSGGPAGTETRPVAGTVRFRGPDGSTARTQVDATGRFAIGLAPGTYTIEGSSPQYEDGKGRCTTDPVRTTLRAGRTATADVFCSMK